LELTIIWPKVLVDIELMHRRWLKAGVVDSLSIYHPKFMGFERALRKLRGRPSDDVVSVTRVVLPFPVQTHVESKSNLVWSDSDAKMVYIDLKDIVDD